MQKHLHRAAKAPKDEAGRLVEAETGERQNPSLLNVRNNFAQWQALEEERARSEGCERVLAGQRCLKGFKKALTLARAPYTTSIKKNVAKAQARVKAKGKKRFADGSCTEDVFDPLGTVVGAALLQNVGRTLSQRPGKISLGLR
ncbi:unnamed protein product [Effrenium voratum]|nr:unnamed protein product [Effrenium voratum]